MAEATLDRANSGETRQCPNHLVFPDVDRCDTCKEHHAESPPDEKAPLPGLKQSFPVVAQHHPVKLTLLETEHPDGILEHYKKIEDQHGEYAYRRNKQQEALDIERQRLQRQRQKTNRANREADSAISRTVWQVADAKKTADDRRRRAESDMQALVVQVKQAEILYEEAQKEVTRRLDEANGLKDQEEAHLAASKELLRVACENTAAAQRRCDELEAASQARLAARAAEFERETRELQAKEEEAAAVAAQHLKEVQERCNERLKSALLDAEVQKQVAIRSKELEAERAVTAKEVTERRRADAQQRLNTERTGIQMHMAAMDQDCRGMVQRVLDREELTKRHYEGFQTGAVALMDNTAQDWFGQAERKGLCTKASLEQTAYVLGHHYKSRWNYTQSVDAKVGDVLHGCLHGREPMASQPPPSPRSLQAPRELPQLVPRIPDRLKTPPGGGSKSPAELTW